MQKTIATEFSLLGVLFSRGPRFISRRIAERAHTLTREHAARGQTVRRVESIGNATPRKFNDAFEVNAMLIVFPPGVATLFLLCPNRMLLTVAGLRQLLFLVAVACAAASGGDI